MMRKRFGLYVVVLLNGIFHLSASAQDSVRLLTWDAAIKETLLHNRQLTISKLEEKAGLLSYRSTEAYFLPQVNLSYTAFTTNNPLHAFGFKLQQQAISQEDFNPELLNAPSSTADFMTQLQVQQPLLNMDLVHMRKAVLKQTEALSLKTNRTKEYLAFRVTEVWLQLQLLYDTKKVIDTALQSVQSLYHFTKNRYEQGLVQKSDMLNTEVMLRAATTSQAEVQSGILDASNRLSILMGKRPGIVYMISGTVKGTVPAGDTLSSARSDFLAMEAGIASVDHMIKSTRDSRLPRIHAFANYQLHDKSMLGFGADGYLAGIQLSWDLFKGNTVRNKMASLKIERDKMSEELQQQKEESRLDMLKTLQQYKDAGYKVSQQTLAVLAAEEAFRVLQNRYGQGLVSTTDVLMAQTQVSNQRLALAQAVFAQQMAAAYLEFLTRSK